MLREASGIKRVILACGRTDLRKGMDSLAALVRLAYGLDPLEEGTLFLFCGLKKDRLKGLVFEGIGFCLLTIRLTDGKFQWPNTPDEARDITMEQYHRLMDGFSIESSIRSYKKVEDESLPERRESANTTLYDSFPHLKDGYKINDVM
jgi:transposase